MEVTTYIKIPQYHSGQLKCCVGFKRYNVVCNGRRWGKTIMAIRLAQKTMINGGDVQKDGSRKGGKVGYFVPTFDFAEDFWEEIKERLEPITIYKSESKRIIRLNTGGELKIWSLEKKRAGRSRKYHRVIIDEACFAKDLKTSWEKAIRPTLADYKGDAFFFSSPLFGTYFQEMFGFADDKKKYFNWASFQMPTSSNPYIDNEELAEIKSQVDPVTYAQEYDAQFVNTNGMRFAHQFKKEKHVKDYGELRKDLPVYLSFDFNRNPITCIASQHPEDHSYIYTRHEFRIPDSDIWALCDRIRTELQGYYFIVTGDASGRNGSTMGKDGAHNYTVIKEELELYDEGQIQVPKRNPLIKNSKLLCNALFFRHPRLFIHPDCEYLIKDFELVQTKPNGDIDKETNPLITHLLDTWRYYVNAFFYAFIKIRMK